MNEEEFFNRMINRICKDYGYEVANSFKLMYLKKDKQLKAYENMRKEALDYLQYFNCDEICENITGIAKKLENILNKVGGSDD